MKNQISFFAPSHKPLATRIDSLTKTFFLSIVLCLATLPTAAQAQWVQTSGLYGGYVDALAVSGSKVFAGTWGGGAFVSTNNGTSWTAVNNGLTAQDVLSLAVSGSTVFAGTSYGGVFVSTNNGTSWTNSGLTNQYVSSLAVSGSTVFAGTDGGGAFVSTNNGTSWTAVNGGLTDQYVYALAVSGSYLLAGTYGSSVFRRPLSDFILATPSDKPNALPASFALSQNYPNPFNPSTVISYQLPIGSQISLKVYDVLGREVATLVNERKAAGSYTATFDASKFSSGVYFYKLQAGNFVQTKKMLLVK
jgi:hypothetical protein